MLYEAAGHPAMEGDVVGVCRACGETGTGVPFEDWVKDTFTNYGELRPGEILCQACQFAFDEHSALLAQRVGKDMPQRMRNYSHFVVAGEWIPLSKANKATMHNILLNRSPDLAVIAISGQKHIIFRARPGWWQIEEQAVRPFPDDLREVLALVEELYQGGLSKGEIETGRYAQYRIMRFGFERWRKAEEALRPRRGGIAMQLAVFLAQKEESDGRDGDGYIGGQVSDGGVVADADLAGRASGLQAQVRHDDMAAVRGQHPKRGLYVEPEQVRQYDLFAAPGKNRGG